MGCASSAALPFLTNRGNQGVAESPRLNGKPPYELKMVNNKLKENGVANVKDINESYVSDKMKEVVDSTAVQGVIGGVIQTKDDLVNQVQGIGETISEKVTSVVDGVEDTIESTFGKLSSAVGSVEDNIKSEVKSIEGDIKSVLNGEANELKEIKESIQPDDIDELLDALPSEEEVSAAVKMTTEEVLEKAADELKEEVAN